MKKQIITICLIVAAMVATTSCSNSAKDKYQAQKAYVDSLQEANTKEINGALLTGTQADALIARMECYHKEVVALDSLKNLAKEAFGDDSAEYKEAYDQKVKAQEEEDAATNVSLNKLKSGL